MLTKATGRLIWENRGTITGVTVEEWWLQIKKTGAAAVVTSHKETIQMLTPLATANKQATVRVSALFVRFR